MANSSSTSCAISDAQMIQPDRVVRTFLDLVAIPSPSEREDEIRIELATRFRALGSDVSVDEHGNLVARWPAGSYQWLLLSAHMDTHEHDRPIRPILRDGVIRTDGTTILGADDKSGLAVIIEALHAVQEAGHPCSGIEIVVTVAEEKGLVGARLLDKTQLRARTGYVVDGDGPTGRIEVGTPSLESIDVLVRGKTAHASKEPEKGISAIRVAAEAIAGMPLGRVDAASIGNIGVIEGGTAANMIPAEVRIQGQARSHDATLLRRQVSAMVEAFERAAARHGAELELQITPRESGYQLAPDAPVVVDAVAAARSVGVIPILDGNATATDANVLNEFGIACAVLSTGVEAKHTPQEHIAVADLVAAARMLEVLLLARK
jgi:tripeptide aminopeptidase